MFNHQTEALVRGVVFLNHATNIFSRTRNYYHGLEKQQVPCSWIDVGSFNELRSIRKKLMILKKANHKVVITSPSHILVIWYLIIFRSRPILDCGWPLSDGVILSRRQFGLTAIKVLLIDGLSFFFSSLVFVESNSQMQRCRRMFPLFREKFKVLMTGVDENRFENFSTNEKSNLSNSKDVFHILFRGGPQEEAGLNVLEESLKRKERDLKIKFRILARGYSRTLPSQSNVELIDAFVSDEYLFKVFFEANLVLGQLSNHDRVRWTVPHKFFESAYFARPYLTASLGEMAIYTNQGIVYGFEPGNSSSFINALDEITQRPESNLAMGISLNSWYQKNASQKVLAERFFKIICED